MNGIAPYISGLVFLLGLIVSFVVWVIKQLKYKDNEITKLNLKINTMEANIKHMCENDLERKKELEWFRDKLQAVSIALEAAKGNLELMVLKSLKTNKR